jgi:pectate lyase
MSGGFGHVWGCCLGLLLTGALESARKSDEWFQGVEGRRALENVLSWQSSSGSWPKNTGTTERRFTGQPQDLHGTFDNGATTGELALLGRAFRATREPRYLEAFNRGLDHILKAQYPSGGWPQSYPPGKQYPRHITFNDDTMVRLLRLLRAVADSADYAFVDRERRQSCQSAFDRGIQCILKCQVRVEGKRTAWCAQHDERTCEPRSGRTYELASLSGAESAGVLLLLMSLDHPSPEVVEAVEAGVAWFEAVKLTGIRQARIDGNKLMVKDPAAPPLWARFYEIGTNRPMFSGRDGIKKYNLAEIESERRNGYAWYGDWGTPVARQYSGWRQRLQNAETRSR